MKKIEVINLDAWVASFLRDQGYEYIISYGDELDKIWDDAIAQAGGSLDYTKNFYVDEWMHQLQDDRRDQEVCFWAFEGNIF